MNCDIIGAPGVVVTAEARCLLTEAFSRRLIKPPIVYRNTAQHMGTYWAGRQPVVLDQAADGTAVLVRMHLIQRYDEKAGDVYLVRSLPGDRLDVAKLDATAKGRITRISRHQPAPGILVEEIAGRFWTVWPTAARR